MKKMTKVIIGVAAVAAAVGAYMAYTNTVKCLRDKESEEDVDDEGIVIPVDSDEEDEDCDEEVTE